MAEYSIISDVSTHIINLLRQKMCPEQIPLPNNIEPASPIDQDMDYILGLYLYDIREEDIISQPQLIPKGRMKHQKPPIPYSLYYMVYINGASQMGLKAPDIQKIIGRVAQILNDNNSVSPEKLQPWIDTQEPPIALSQAKISMEEKARVWQAINKPYQLSLFYRAAPVFISSEVVVDTPRVIDAGFVLNIAEEERRKSQ